VALSDVTRKRIEAEARKRGLDPAEAIAQAESRGTSPATSPAKDPATPAGSADSNAPSRPIAERLLIGFLPFIKVRELRSLWLGLPDRIPDDELTCGEYSIKHGGAPGSATDTPTDE